MMIKIRKILTILALVSITSACSMFSKQEEPERYMEPRFSNEEAIPLKVKQVDVVSEFTPSFTRPNVEHLFPISIEKTAKNWGKDRLKAVDFGSTKVATVIIKDASVTEEIEKSTEVFQKDRIKYRANLNVIVKVNDYFSSISW